MGFWANQGICTRLKELVFGKNNSFIIAYMSVERLNYEKQRARSGLILFVLESLFGIVVGKEDPFDSWDILQWMYNVGNQQQILYLTNKMHSIPLKERGGVTVYLMEVSNLQNHLTAVGEVVSDRQLVNIVLNGLPHSFDMIIQGISYLPNSTFEDVMEKILMET
jgi:hypothetical protein